MEYRTLGRTGLKVSALGFGCGDVGGIIVRGAPAERERAVARALEAGINYFDTAAAYGNGVSETNLGATLRALRARPWVGTKVRVPPEDKDTAGAIRRSVEASLTRLAFERVDLLQLHNLVVGGQPLSGNALSLRRVLDEVVPALEALRREGKTRFIGVTALGDTRALHDLLEAGVIDTAQVCVNLLNPTAAVAVPAGFPAHDFDRLLDHARRAGVGTIAIRVLAAGALSGTTSRHPVAMPSVAPIASGADYAQDVARARRLQPLVEAGHAATLMEASIRFALAHEGISTVLVGTSEPAHLEAALAAVERGPLPPAALETLRGLWAGLAGEAR
ncbi:MAG TPA: aldo/keto reductase [Methylomirabilota bacterium]|nr:aldo/keto reductase [Methylomirabilota bacterium]